jgi:hypothetical protein
LEGNILKFRKSLSLLMASVLFLGACGNSSLKAESKSTVKAVKAAFSKKAKAPAKSSGNIHFYLPFGYDIKDEKQNNIILKNGANTYILFHNPQESKASEVVYNASVAQYNKLNTNEKFANNHRIGFVLIKNLKDDINELTIGIGGTKITSQVKTADLTNEAKNMIEIVKSVKYKN